MSAHTKTPWRAGRGCVVADVPVPGMGGSDAVEYYGGHLVAESITAENVEFIVRACNSHDALIEKLKAQFHAVDWLMAKLIEADPTFMPSKSQIWDSIKGTHEILAAAGAK
jgi:hypothetical protein